MLLSIYCTTSLSFAPPHKFLIEVSLQFETLVEGEVRG
jgi:hypothetical protein